MPDPCHNPEAEISVLGAMLIHNAMIEPVAAIVGAGDFTVASHRKLFQAMVDLRASGVAVDDTTVLDRASNVLGMDKGATAELIMALTDATPAAANAEHYARIVRDASRLRKLGKIGAHLESQAKAQGAEVAELAARANDAILSILAPTAADAISTAREAMSEHTRQIDEAATAERPILVATGIAELDGLVTGLASGRMVVIGGGTHAGKTALACNVALGVAAQGYRVLYATLEMSAAEIAGNLAMMSGGPPTRVLLSGRMDKAQYQSYAKAAADVAALPIKILDPPRLTLAELSGLSRAAFGVERPFLIVVDYLQLMTPPKGDNREQAVAALANGLKALSRELPCCVLALAQLNRIRVGDSPDLQQSLRESSAIGQAGDCTWFVTRPCGGLSEDQKQERLESGKPVDDDFAIIQVAKDRVTGQLGTVVVGWDKDHMRFGGTAPGHVLRAMGR